MKNFCGSSTHGFSLLEVTLAMLLMGLSVSGLLNMMQFGQLRYGAIDSGWRQRQELARLHRFFQAAVASGEPLASLSLPILQGVAGGVHLASWSWSVAPPDGVFVQARLYEDRNHNARQDPAEAISPQVWVFRVRTDR